MYWNPSPERIWEYNPGMKIIAILRNPIDRAYTNWNMGKSRNAEDLSFWEAITNETERCREALPLQHRIHSYIDRGYYVGQLRQLWFYFTKDPVLILQNEYLREHPTEAVNDVCKFLGADPFDHIENQDVHSIQLGDDSCGEDLPSQNF
jgi:hypothetical protein